VVTSIILRVLPEIENENTVREKAIIKNKGITACLGWVKTIPAL
jgi:hypothetical protein